MPSNTENSDELDEWRSFRAFLRGERIARNVPQENLRLAWTAIEIVDGDGVELLAEQNEPLSDYAAALEAVGIPKVVPILAKAEPLSGENYNDESFEALKKLNEEFWEVCNNSDETLWQYIDRHHEDFAEYVD